MAKVRKTESEDSQPKHRPPLTPEAKENQMISYAMDLAEKQLRDGTASSQVITHFLKLGSIREKMERQRLEEENKLLRAKTEEIESSKENKALYKDAIKAFKLYSGQSTEEDDEYDY